MALHPEFLSRPIAHRGLHDLAAGQIENSMAAFLAAIEHGYAIELDLQMSKDQQAMVFHDHALERLTGHHGPVAHRPSAELKALSLKTQTGGMPHLSEVLDLVAGRVPILVEIKDQDGQLGPNTGSLERQAAQLLRTYSGPLAVMSFNPHSIASFAQHAPDISVGLTTSNFNEDAWNILPEKRRAELRQIVDFDRLKLDFISHRAADLNSGAVAAIRAKGTPILCWTIRSPVEEKAARACADNITFEGYLPAHA